MIVKIIQDGDTIRYIKPNDPQATVNIILIWELKSIHFENGRIIDYGLDYLQDRGKIFVKFGGAVSNERPALLPGLKEANAKAGISASCGFEGKKMGTQKKLALDGELSYIQKGGYAHSPCEFFDLNGQELGWQDVTSGEQINYLSATVAIKYYVSKYLYLKAGLNENYLLNYLATANMYSGETITAYSNPLQKESYNKLTTGLTYGVGIASLPRKVGILVELIGLTDLSPAGRSAQYYPAYYSNSFALNFGVFLNLSQGKKIQ